MKSYFCLLIGLITVFSANSESVECEDGWIAYKDKRCIKIFTESFVNYDEAKQFCTAQGNENTEASLLAVKEPGIQSLLANYTHNIYEYVWLGAKYDRKSQQFTWEDGEELIYNNWEKGHAINNNDTDICIEFMPTNSRSSLNSKGKWAAVTCQKRNLVICQRSWTLPDALTEIIRMQKKHAGDISGLRQEFQNELQAVASRVVPVGSIYIEYYGQPSPATLWPSLKWEDVSRTYGGLFFRASGEGSAEWGVTQDECAPRLTEFKEYRGRHENFPEVTYIPRSGWSAYGQSGYHHTIGGPAADRFYEGLSFYTEDCQVRPKNQAIRMWKRIE